MQDAIDNLALVEIRVGTFDQARGLLGRALDAIRGLHAGYEVFSTQCLGLIGFLAGEPELARVELERGLRHAEPQGVLVHQMVHGRLGQQLLLDGRVTEAIEALEYAQSLSKDGNRTQEPWIATALAGARLAAGDLARAQSEAESAFRQCLALDARLLGIDAALVVAACRRARQGMDAAAEIAEVLATADRLIVETGARNMTAFVLVERAALAALRGDARQEAEHLHAAYAEFVRMGATGRAREAMARLEGLRA